MNRLYQEWQKYVEITSKYSEAYYGGLDVVKIEKKKSAWGGCCYSSKGLIGITNSSREIMLVEPATGLIDTFGKMKVGTFKWTGGCEYKGKCYGFPRKENSLLVIDYKNRDAYTHKLNISYRGEHHYGGILTPDGIAYQPPRNTDHMLKIDLNTYETDRVDMPYTEGTCRYSSAVLHPSGEIYLIPEFGYRMAILYPDTEEIEYFGERSDHLVFGAVVGIDENIYGYSKEGNGILKIDVKNKNAEYICQEIGNPDCYGSVVGINGKIYGIPGGGNTIWEFDVNSQKVRKAFEIKEKGYAKCAGGGVDIDGTIAMMPCFGGYIYLLKCNQKVRTSHDIIAARFLNDYY